MGEDEIIQIATRVGIALAVTVILWAVGWLGRFLRWSWRLAGRAFRWFLSLLGFVHKSEIPDPIPDAQPDADALEYDRRIFEESDAIFSHGDCMDFLEEVYQHRCSWNRTAAIENWDRYFVHDGNAYLAPEVQEAQERATKCILGVRGFVATHFFGDERGGDWSRLPRPRSDNPADVASAHRAFDDRVRELNALLDEADEAFKAYRATVREHLRV